MELLGVSVRVGNTDGVEVRISRVKVKKETEKSYALQNTSSLMFNCLTRIDKAMIGQIQNDGSYGHGYVTSIERKVWLVDDDLNEKDVIEMLKQEVIKEIEARMSMLNVFEQQLNNKESYKIRDNYN